MSASQQGSISEPVGILKKMQFRLPSELLIASSLEKRPEQTELCPGSKEGAGVGLPWLVLSWSGISALQSGQAIKANSVFHGCLCAFIRGLHDDIVHQKICCLGTSAQAEIAKVPFNILLYLWSLHLVISLLQKHMPKSVHKSIMCNIEKKWK